MGTDAFETLSQCLGLNYNEHGLLHDRALRTIVRPVDHVLRDYMHMLLNNGVGNTHVACVINALWRITRTPMATVSAFMMQFVLPKRFGKVDANWLSIKRLGKKRKALQSFSNIMPTLIPIIFCFFEERFATGSPHAARFAEHVECFGCLATIIGLCGLGPERVMPYVDVLGAVIQQYVELFVKLYGEEAVLPKFHQFFAHLIENMVYLGKL